MFDYLVATMFFVIVPACNLCSDEIMREVNSPDKLLRATWYVRDCGATTDFTTLVSVHKADSSFRDDSEIVLVAKGRGRLQLKWNGTRQLFIRCEGCEHKDIFKLVSKLDDIDIVLGTQ